MIPQQPWAGLCIPRNPVSQHSSADGSPHSSVFLKHDSSLPKLLSHVNPGPNSVSDAPSSVHHGQMQREEMAGEFPAFSAVLNHLFVSTRAWREPRRHEILHISLPVLSSLQSLGVRVERAAGKPWKTQLLWCLAAHPGAWRTPGQTQELNPFQPWNEEPRV